jgi:hypothetical protein
MSSPGHNKGPGNRAFETRMFRNRKIFKVTDRCHPTMTSKGNDYVKTTMRRLDDLYELVSALEEKADEILEELSALLDKGACREAAEYDEMGDDEPMYI